MDEFGLCTPDHAVALFADAQAEVHIVEGDGVAVLLQPAQTLVELAVHQHAGGGDCTELPVELVGAQIAGVGVHEGVANMSGQPVHANHHAAVLHHAIGPTQLGTDQAHTGPQHLRHHLLQPVWVQHFDIVVDQPKNVAAGLGRSPIVDGGIVEGMGVAQYTQV